MSSPWNSSIRPAVILLGRRRGVHRQSAVRDEPGPGRSQRPRGRPEWPTHRPNAYLRLFRARPPTTSAGRWKTWLAISGTIIVIGLISIATRGLNFSIDFKGGTVWEVPSSASVSHVRDVVNNVVPGYGQATITILTNSETGQRTVKVEDSAKLTSDPAQGRHGAERGGQDGRSIAQRRAVSTTSGRPGGPISPTRRSRR